MQIRGKLRKKRKCGLCTSFVLAMQYSFFWIYFDSTGMRERTLDLHVVVITLQLHVLPPY